MLVTQKPKYDDAKKVCSSHTYNKVPINTNEMCFTVTDSGILRKMGFLGWWCYLSPLGGCYYKPSYCARGSIILKKQQICESYGKIWY